MIIPLVGLFTACAIFAGLGVAVLSLVPRLRLTLANLGLFVIGSVPTAAAAAIAYGRVFGDVTGELNSGAVLGLFGVMPVAGLCGGLLAVLVYGRLMRTMHWQRESSTAAKEHSGQAQN